MPNSLICLLLHLLGHSSLLKRYSAAFHNANFTSTTWNLRVRMWSHWHIKIHTQRKCWINAHTQLILPVQINQAYTPKVFHWQANEFLFLWGAAYMCVMILCRKTPSTSSMNMLTRSSDPTSSEEPKGPSVRTYRERGQLCCTTTICWLTTCRVF